MRHQYAWWDEGHIGPAQRCKTLSSRQRLAMTHVGGYDAGHRHGSVWSPTTWEVRHGPHTNRHTQTTSLSSSGRPLMQRPPGAGAPSLVAPVP